jgi:biopolymer transport protein ExbD
MIDFYLNLFLLMVMLALPVEKKNELLQMNLPVSKSGSAAKATQNEVLIITVSSDLRFWKKRRLVRLSVRIKLLFLI